LQLVDRRVGLSVFEFVCGIIQFAVQAVLQIGFNTAICNVGIDFIHNCDHSLRGCSRRRSRSSGRDGIVHTFNGLYAVADIIVKILERRQQLKSLRMGD